MRQRPTATAGWMRWRRWFMWVAVALGWMSQAGCGSLLAPAAPVAAAAGAAPAVRVVVDAPEAIRRLLEQHLDLARLQQLRDDEAPDDTEWNRLVAAAPAQARELLQTEGWFDASVQVTRERSDTGPGLVRVVVVPGQQVSVRAVNVLPAGPLARDVAANDGDAAATLAQLRSANILRTGKPFRNADWADTKQQWLARLRADGYASARIDSSRADIDTAAHAADLSVTIDSGPRYLAGPMLIEGLKVHDADTVRHLSGIDPGMPLTETRLLDFQDRLQKTGLFERATVSFEPDEGNAMATPVRVALSELPLQQATVGLGVSANTGPRASLEHTHRRPFGWAITTYNKLEWGRDNQAWTGDFYSHPGEGFYRNLFGVQLSRVKSDTDIVTSQRLRLGRTQDTPRIERLYFVEWLRSRQSDLLGVQSASALSGNYNLVWRDLDSVLLPTRGLTVSLQVGAGEAYSRDAPSGPFARLYGRITGYLPLGEQWYGQARIEAGEIVKQDSVEVPDALGFRAGGDDSVRGYAYRTLAPTLSDGTVRSGIMLLTGSLELARPLSPSLPQVWGAVFVDAGRAVSKWSDYSAALGYGVGVRWRSPIGPLRVDLAWAEELRKLRLHMSVGIAF